MNPFDVKKDESESRHQAAIFSWIRMAAAYGLVAANDPHSYKEKEEKLQPYEWGEDLRGIALECAFAVPNSIHSNPRMGAIWRAQGLNEGVPDFFIPWGVGPTAMGFFCELKTVQGKLSDVQKKKIDGLTRLGYYCVVSRGWLTTVTEIQRYMGFAQTEKQQ